MLARMEQKISDTEAEAAALGEIADQSTHTSLEEELHAALPAPDDNNDTLENQIAALKQGLS